MAALRGSSLALVHCFQSNRGAIGTGASMHLIAQASLSSLAATRGCTSASIYPFPSSRFLTSFTMQPKTELHLSSWMQPHITKLATLRSHTVVINGGRAIPNNSVRYSAHPIHTMLRHGTWPPSNTHPLKDLVKPSDRVHSFRGSMISCTTVGLARYYSQWSSQGSSRNSRYGKMSLPNNSFLKSVPDWQKVFAVILTINVAVFLLWQNANFVASEHHDGSQLKWMRDHFSLTTNGIFVDGRIWTAITCGFSHITALHLGMNMFVLYSFIETMVSTLGVRRFAWVYISAGIGSSIVSILSMAYKQSSEYQQRRRNPFSFKDSPFYVYQSVGASGCISGLLTLFVLNYPRSTILLFFVVPLPAWVIGGGVVAYDLYNTVRGSSRNIDSAGHLGGALVGLVWWLAMARRGRIRY
ncbi:hypothetical protein BASA62_003736 [Batrachochytrium salamandrivorans]|nr:hypothetical protein BASA62_003736 [Batrachochytrium salamandrivorans]